MSAWFDYPTYLNNKVAQLQKTDKAGDWTLPKVMQAFADAGFGGAAGAEQHFMQFGQYEDVAPNAFFNPMEYYRAKAAHAFGKQNAPQTVTEIEINEVMMAIKGLKMGAWSHFKAFGNNEHVNPSNQFDCDAYVNAKVDALNAVRPDGQAAYTAKDVYAAFQGIGLSALEHFMMFGGDATKGEVPYKYDGTIPSVFEVPVEKQVKPDDTNAGYTFILTDEVDTITSTNNTTGKPTDTAFAGGLDDTFVAVANGTGTLNAGDTLDGAGGHNTLRIMGEAAGSANLGSVTLANIQTVELTGKVATDAPLDASAHKDVVKNLIIKNVDATAAKDSTSTAASATFTADISQTVTLAGDLIFADGSGGVITYKGLKTDGTDDSALLKMNGLTVKDADLTDSDTGTITVADVENLTLSLSGANDFATLTAADLKTLTLTGAGTAKGTVVGDSTSAGKTISSIDASTAGGADLSISTGDMKVDGFTYAGSKNADKLNLTGASNAAKLNIDLGDGDNQLTINVSGGLASGSSFKAGAGLKDKLIIAAGSASQVTSAVASAFSGFEVLSTALDGLDVSLFKDITSVEVTGNAGLTNLNAKQAENILVTGTSGPNGKAFALKDATGTNDSIGFTLKHATSPTGVVNITGATLDGFESLTLKAESGVKEILASGQTAGTTYSNVTLTSATDLKSVKLTGDYTLGLNTSGATKLALIDARENTAGVDITLAATTIAQEVFGSEKMDRFDITAPTGNGSVTLKAGGGNDTVTVALEDLAAGNITLDGGAGLNTLKLDDAANATTESYTINDTDFANVSNFGAVEIIEKHAGDTNITLGASAAALAASNGGVLKITADLGASIQATDSISFRSTAMNASSAVELILSNDGDSDVTIQTGGGNDKIELTVTSGGTGTVIAVDGGAGNDIITVTADSASSITIKGGAGNDTITGSAVADIIIGGAGADIMTGGAGNDIFRYEAAGESNGANIDWIQDFAAGGSADKINLSGSVLKGVAISTGTTTVGSAFQTSITITSAADLADLQAQLTNSAAVKTAYTGSTAAADGVQAGQIVVTSGAFAGTYVLINDATAGYNAADDILINVTGISGTLDSGDFTFTA